METNSCIVYSGTVSHTRLAPVVHGFAYNVAMLLVDIDRPEAAFRGCWPLGGLSWAAATFRESDHMKARRRGASLADAVRELIAERTGLRRPEGRILLLTNPAYFGYFFAPVSFYYVFEERGGPVKSGSRPALHCVVAEVNNTPWNEQHCYVLHPNCPDVRTFSAVTSVTDHPGCTAEFEDEAPLKQRSGSSGLAALGSFPTWDEASWIAWPASKSCPGDTSSIKSSNVRGDVVSSGSAAAESSGADVAGPRRRGHGARGSSAADTCVASSPTAAAACPASAGREAGWLRFLWGKAFHVSPFMPMDQAYDWMFNTPQPLACTGSQSGTRSNAGILIRSRNLQLSMDAAPKLGGCPAAPVAAVSAPPASVGARHPVSPAVAAAGKPATDAGPCVFTTQTRLRCEGEVSIMRLLWLLLFAFPLLTLRLQWWIHAEAVRLYRKGVPLFAHPSPDGGPQTLLMRMVSSLAALLLPVVAFFRRWALR